MPWIYCPKYAIKNSFTQLINRRMSFKSRKWKMKMSTNATCLHRVGPFFGPATWPWLGAIGARSSERQATQFQWMATACNLGWAGVWWSGVGRLWCVWQASGADTIVIRVSDLPGPNLHPNLTRSKTTPKFRPKFTAEFRHSLRINCEPLAPKTPRQSFRKNI